MKEAAEKDGCEEFNNVLKRLLGQASAEAEKEDDI